MRVLVTGASGFVGSALCPHLAALGHEVLPAVRKPSGVTSGIVRECIVQNALSLQAALKGCDSVIHLAARVHVMNDYEQDSLEVFRVNNVDTTLELANYAVKAGVRRFVFMSSIKVNGEETPHGGSFKPDDLVNPMDSYAISKLEAERGLMEIARKTGLEVVIIRPPLVYGPGVKGNFASLIKWVKYGVPLPLGAIHNLRSMIGLDNLLSFTALCADMKSSPNAKWQVFLVSDGQDVSTPELLRRVAKAYECKSRLFSVPVGHMYLAARWIGKPSLADRLLGSLVIDDSKARQMLGWNTVCSMDEQLKKMALHDSLI